MTQEEMNVKLAQAISDVMKTSRNSDKMITDVVTLLTKRVIELAQAINEQNQQIKDMKVRIDYLESKEEDQ